MFTTRKHKRPFFFISLKRLNATTDGSCLTSLQNCYRRQRTFSLDFIKTVLKCSEANIANTVRKYVIFYYID